MKLKNVFPIRLLKEVFGVGKERANKKVVESAKESKKSDNSVKEKRSVLVAECQEGIFVELYLDLYKTTYGFMLKTTSYHYNAGQAKVLNEQDIPGNLKTVDKIIKFIADAGSYRFRTNYQELMREERLIDFINENL